MSTLPGSSGAQASHPRTLLDLGCGPAALRRLLPADIAYYGADLTAEALPPGRESDRFAVADLNADADPFPGRTFDVLVVSGMFEYVRDPRAFLTLVRRKTRPGGHLVLTYLNRWHHRELRARLLHRAPTYPDPHINFISIAEAARGIKASGFVIESYAMLSAGQRVLPVVPGTLHFPLNVLARTFVFVCRRL
ncbi:class I SAM-dependent methyltransferase [Roseisolibacter agri]|uniref:class I SAM-dependent methyltransferase n=1 Tax=Roseisolibacter agri TaxID=2014610 RepID=UPI0024E0A623|nr:class I SAM-dependent methyltransferase [Roseisolibacter agri]